MSIVAWLKRVTRRKLDDEDFEEEVRAHLAIAQDERSQTRNRELALERLRERLAQALAVPKRRRPTRPTAASRERRLEAKRRGAERKRERRPPEDG